MTNQSPSGSPLESYAFPNSSNLYLMNNIVGELIAEFPDEIPVIDSAKVVVQKEQIHALADYIRQKIGKSQESICVAVRSDNPSFWAASIALATLELPSVNIAHNQKPGRFVSHTLELDIANDHFPDFDQINLQPNPDFEPKVPADTNRIMLTSGTTGRPKAVVFTEELVRTRLQRIDQYWTNELTELDLMGVNSTGGFFTALKALEQKRTAYLPSKADVFEIHAFSHKSIEVIAGSPIQLRDFIAITEQNKSRFSDLKLIRVAGGSMPKQLQKQLMERFSVPLQTVYGATETGGVFSYWDSTEFESNLVGKLLPGCEAALSEDGELIVKTPDLAKNYLHAEATDSEGWFHTGDSAEVDQEGNWRIIPRGENLVNLGGPKVNLSDIDNSAQSNPGVDDAACFPHTDKDGLQRLAIAVVGNYLFDWKALDAQLRREYGNSAPQTIVKVDVIPRANSGKAQRTQLAKQNPV